MWLHVPHCSYAQRAKRIKNNARVNVDASSATVAMLRRQVVQLRQQLLQCRGGGAVVDSAPSRVGALPAAPAAGSASVSGTCGASCVRSTTRPRSVRVPVALSLTDTRGYHAFAATDEALYQAIQRVAALEARNRALEESLTEASLAATKASDDYAELAGRLLDTELELDMLR